MPQQINLCTPILLTQKRYFSAQTMVQALAVFVVLGGGLCAYWVWSLNTASDGFKVTLATQARELESLQVATAQGKARAAPVDAALKQASQARLAEVAPQVQERLIAVMAAMDPATLSQMAVALEFVASSVAAQDEAPPMFFEGEEEGHPPVGGEKRDPE